MDAPLTLEEMRRAILRSGLTSPGKDKICVAASLRLLGLYNKVWEAGKLPGKDSSNPMNYKPIALTSHLGKIMERMITERLTFYMESKGLFSPNQSGFRKGRGTMDPVMCLETEVRKANKVKLKLIKNL